MLGLEFCPRRLIVKVRTERFSELEVDRRDILHFKTGLFGEQFENLNKFVIVDPGDRTFILWLQSFESPRVAFPILEPKIFYPGYAVKLHPFELDSLELQSISEASVYTILTIPRDDVTKMSANLKAPIVINGKNCRGKQIVLQDSRLASSFLMYREFKTYVSAHTSDDARRVPAKVFQPGAESV